MQIEPYLYFNGRCEEALTDNHGTLILRDERLRALIARTVVSGKIAATKRYSLGAGAGSLRTSGGRHD